MCRDTFNEFLIAVRNAISKKPNFSCRNDPTTENCITGPHNIKYYHPKVEEAFQAWLMKNQANQGRSSQVVKQATTQAVEKDLVKEENNNNWTSKKELMNNLQISSDTIEQIISDLSCRRPADTQNHIKKGGYHNSEVFYDDYLVNMITAELAKQKTIRTNQTNGTRFKLYCRNRLEKMERSKKRISTEF